jgi:hypothetical protein
MDVFSGIYRTESTVHIYSAKGAESSLSNWCVGVEYYAKMMIFVKVVYRFNFFHRLYLCTSKRRKNTIIKTLEISPTLTDKITLQLDRSNVNMYIDSFLRSTLRVLENNL